jgi:hypothetical protein
MNRRTAALVAFFLVLSLVSVGVWAQDQRRGGPAVVAAQPPVLTGDDIGFQPILTNEKARNGAVIGKWMVKIDGKWVETQSPVGPVR